MTETPLTDQNVRYAINNNPFAHVVPAEHCRKIEERLYEALDMLNRADDDIRELLQVAKYNLYGQMNTGEYVDPPNPPVLVHEKGIQTSEGVRRAIRAVVINSKMKII